MIAYAYGPSPTPDQTNSALREAIVTLPTDATPLVHSSQGVQYQHTSWGALLADAGQTQSLSRRGSHLDNAVAENFFGHVKEEVFQHNRFDAVQDSRPR